MTTKLTDERIRDLHDIDWEGTLEETPIERLKYAFCTTPEEKEMVKRILLMGYEKRGEYSERRRHIGDYYEGMDPAEDPNLEGTNVDDIDFSFCTTKEDKELVKKLLLMTYDEREEYFNDPDNQLPLPVCEELADILVERDVRNLYGWQDATLTHAFNLRHPVPNDADSAINVAEGEREYWRGIPLRQAVKEAIEHKVDNHAWGYWFGMGDIQDEDGNDVSPDELIQKLDKIATLPLEELVSHLTGEMPYNIVAAIRYKELTGEDYPKED